MAEEGKKERGKEGKRKRRKEGKKERGQEGSKDRMSRAGGEKSVVVVHMWLNEEGRG